MKTVLIAEDEPSSYTLLNVMLRGKYHILKASDGVEAVEMARQHRPDFILMDVKMPYKSGLLAISEIRTFMPEVPIIVQSAYAYDSDISLAEHYGADGYLTKPIQKQELDDILAKFG